MRRSTRQTVVTYAAAVVCVVLALAPVLFMVVASVSAPVDLLRRPLDWVPHSITLHRYHDIFRDGSGGSTFLHALVNSTVVAIAAVVVSLAVGMPGAYAFARLRFRFRESLLLLFLMTYMLPPISLLIPLYLLAARLGLLDSRLGLVIVYCSIITPFVLWVMSSFFEALPVELEEQGKIDGLSQLGVFLRIVLPLSRPSILSTFLLGFLLSWDEFLYALIFTTSDASKTVPVAIAEFTGRNAVDFGLISTAGVIACIPPVLIAVVFQRQIVGGLTAGALKG